MCWMKLLKNLDMFFYPTPFIMDVKTYPCWNGSLFVLEKVTTVRKIKHMVAQISLVYYSTSFVN